MLACDFPDAGGRYTSPSDDYVTLEEPVLLNSVTVQTVANIRIRLLL